MMSRIERAVRRTAHTVSQTPLHPQWFSFRAKRLAAASVAAAVRGRVLDVGCADGELRRLLDPSCEYIGYDYPVTATQLYETRPAVFGDAQALPFATGSFDAVVILDVLEHLRDPLACLTEAKRVVREGGNVLVHVPFLYPLHDEPFDFWRLTAHGLREIFRRAGLTVVTLQSKGAPAETAALLANLAISHAVLQTASRFPPALMLLPVVAPLILLINCLGWLLARRSTDDSFMPISYWLHASASPSAESRPTPRLA